MFNKLKTFKIEILIIALGLIFGILYYFIPIKYLLLLIAGFFISILIFFRVEIGIFAAVFCLPFLPTPATICLVLIIVASFVIKVISQNIKLKYSPLCPWIVAFAIINVFYALTSVTPKSSIEVAAVILSYIALFFVTINTIKDKRQLYTLILILIASATLESLYGIYQYRIGVPTIDENWTDTTLFPETTTRVFGTLDNPNILAQYLEFAIPICLGLFWICKSIWEKFIYLGIMGIMGLCLIFTSSRGGWIACALAVFVFGVLKDRRILILGALAGIISLNFLPSSIMDRIASIGSFNDSSNTYRIFIWNSTVDMIKDFWYSGVGLGVNAFSKIYNSYYIRVGVYAFHAHNLYLETLVEIGIIGFLSFLIIIYKFFKHGILSFLNIKDEFSKTMIAALLGGMSGFLLHGISENSFYSFKIVFMFWLIIALVMSIREINMQKELTI